MDYAKDTDITSNEMSCKAEGLIHTRQGPRGLKQKAKTRSGRAKFKTRKASIAFVSLHTKYL